MTDPDHIADHEWANRTADEWLLQGPQRVGHASHNLALAYRARTDAGHIAALRTAIRDALIDIEPDVPMTLFQWESWRRLAIGRFRHVLAAAPAQPQGGGDADDLLVDYQDQLNAHRLALRWNKTKIDHAIVMLGNGSTRRSIAKWLGQQDTAQPRKASK